MPFPERLEVQKVAGHLARFSRDDETQVRAVLHDLCDSQLLFTAGTGASTMYRAASVEELTALQRHGGADELVVAFDYLIRSSAPAA